MENTKAIATVDEATRALAKAETIEEVSTLRDWSKAAVEVAKALGRAADAQKAKELQLRAERKAGAILAEMPERRGQHMKDEKSQAETFQKLGIDHNTANRWQRLAGMPDPEFDKWITQAKQEGELTQAAAIRAANEYLYGKEYIAAQAVVKAKLEELNIDADMADVIHKSPEAKAFCDTLDEEENKELVVEVAQRFGRVRPATFKESVANIKAELKRPPIVIPHTPDEPRALIDHLREAHVAAQVFAKHVRENLTGEEEYYDGMVKSMDAWIEQLINSLEDVRRAIW